MTLRHGAARFDQESIGQPLADAIYRNTFGQDIRIERNADVHLSHTLGVDVVITTPQGLRLLGQEKYLSHAYAKYRSLTVEYYQDASTGEEGNWFNLACQFYFVGYLNKDETAFEPWVLANWTEIVLATAKGRIHWKSNSNKDGQARASFRYTAMDRLPQRCVIATSKGVSDESLERPW